MLTVLKEYGPAARVVVIGQAGHAEAGAGLEMVAAVQHHFAADSARAVAAAPVECGQLAL